MQQFCNSLLVIRRIRVWLALSRKTVQNTCPLFRKLVMIITYNLIVCCSFVHFGLQPREGLVCYGQWLQMVNPLRLSGNDVRIYKTNNSNPYQEQAGYMHNIIWSRVALSLMNYFKCSQLMIEYSEY